MKKIGYKFCLNNQLLVDKSSSIIFIKKYALAKLCSIVEGIKTQPIKKSLSKVNQGNEYSTVYYYKNKGNFI